MYWEDIEELTDKAIVVPDSNVYHLVMNSNPGVTRELRSVCGNVGSSSNYSSPTERDLEEVVDGERRACIACKKWVNKFFGVDVHTCNICNRLNILHDMNWFEYEIPYSVGDGDVAHICLSCKARLNIQD